MNRFWFVAKGIGAACTTKICTYIYIYLCFSYVLVSNSLSAPLSVYIQHGDLTAA